MNSSGEAPSLAMLIGCTLCLSAGTHRATEWVMQLPMCSGEVPCSDRMKAVFGDEQDYRLDSLPKYRARSSSKASKVICLLS